MDQHLRQNHGSWGTEKKIAMLEVGLITKEKKRFVGKGVMDVLLEGQL